MSDQEMSAAELGDAIAAAQRDIVQELDFLAKRLPEGFLLTACDVDVVADRTYGGDVHYRFAALISMRLKD